MTPDPRMNVRIAARFDQLDLRTHVERLIAIAEKQRAILQDMIQSTQEEIRPEFITEGLRNEIQNAKEVICETDAVIAHARVTLAKEVQ